MAIDCREALEIVHGGCEVKDEGKNLPVAGSSMCSRAAYQRREAVQPKTSFH